MHFQYGKVVCKWGDSMLTGIQHFFSAYFVFRVYTIFLISLFSFPLCLFCTFCFVIRRTQHTAQHARIQIGWMRCKISPHFADHITDAIDTIKYITERDEWRRICSSSNTVTEKRKKLGTDDSFSFGIFISFWQIIRNSRKFNNENEITANICRYKYVLLRSVRFGWMETVFFHLLLPPRCWLLVRVWMTPYCFCAHSVHSVHCADIILRVRLYLCVRNLFEWMLLRLPSLLTTEQRATGRWGMREEYE